MGGRNGGRYPKPLEVHRLNGNPSKLDLDKLAELAPTPVLFDTVPAPPDTLSKRAKECWIQNAPVLFEMGVLTMADLDTLFDYCVMFDAKMTALEAMKADGDAGVMDPGTERRAPGMAAPFKVYMEASAKMQAIAREFGMTASARARMGIQLDKNNQDADEMEMLLG